MTEFLNSVTLLLILLNPFLVIVYLLELVQTLNLKVFSRVLIRGSFIALGIFIFFALLGDVVFRDFLHAEFASFQIFGGIVFLIIGINFMLKGNVAIEALRGPPELAAAPIAMPILVGPATVSASVIIGENLAPLIAVLAVFTAVGITVFIMIFLKILHDWVKPRNEVLVQRYTEVAGRVLAIIIGIFAIEMIMQGTSVWIGRIFAGGRG
jgi:small neutral amino acid transporter SnatA (MarC family)